MCISCAGKVTLHSSPRPARLLLWAVRAGLLKRSVLLDSAGEFTSQKISPRALSWVSSRGTCALWVTDLPSRLREGSVFTPRLEGAPGAQLDSAPSPALEAGSLTGASAREVGRGARCPQRGRWSVSAQSLIFVLPPACSVWVLTMSRCSYKGLPWNSQKLMSWSRVSRLHRFGQKGPPGCSSLNVNPQKGGEIDILKFTYGRVISLRVSNC